MLALASLGAALVSVWAQGFFFGIVNNVFHVPLVLDWAARPEFAHDPFVSSLSNFVSGLWLLVRPLATEDNVESLFLMLHVLSRWSTLAAIGIVLGQFGITGRSRNLMLLWLGVAPLLAGANVDNRIGSSAVGDHGLFIRYFTHTEVTNGLVLLCLSLAARGHLVWALALNGIVFDVNAFVAVWNGCALAAAVVGIAAREPGRRRAILRSAGAGTALAVLLAAPVLVWIGATLVGGVAAAEFDYAAFLRGYYPHHSFIDAASLPALLNLAGVVFCGWAALAAIGVPARIWRDAFVGLAVVLLVGMAVPYLTHARLVLTLHLLRVDGVIQLVTAVMAAVAAVHRMRGGAWWNGVGALAALSLSAEAGPLVAGAILLHPLVASPRSQMLLRLGAALGAVFFALYHGGEPLTRVQLAVLAALPTVIVHIDRVSSAVACRAGIAVIAAFTLMKAAELHDAPYFEMRNAADWREIGAWARASTREDSVFLTPLRVFPDFQLFARRSTWVDWKRGAAVMWHPSYYPIWSQRMTEVGRLRTTAELTAYACAHDIDYVVRAKAYPGDAEPVAHVVKETAAFIVIDAAAGCPARPSGMVQE